MSGTAASTPWRRLRGAVDRLAHLLFLVSGGVLVAMIVTVLADIASRSLFGLTGGALDVTFRGGVELTRYGLLFAVLFAMPHAVDRGQVVVDLFAQRLGARARRLFEGLYGLAFGLFGVAMAVHFRDAVGRDLASGETTQDLMVPMVFLHATALFAGAALALRGLLVGLDPILGPGRRT